MAKTTTNPLTQSIKNTGTIILNATSAQSINTSGVVSNNVTVFTAGAEGSVLKSLLLATNDSAARYVSIWIQPGGAGNIVLLGTVAVPATSGLSATGVLINIDVLANGYIAGLVLDQSNRPVLPLAASTVVSVGLVAQLTADKALYVTAIGEDF